MSQQITKSSGSRWPFRMAVLLCCATYPLIWVGGLVTTYDAGMAVPDWPTTYGYNMFRYPLSTWLSGPFDLFIEHGHRLLGSFVGLLTILLVVVTVRAKAHRYVIYFAIGCLVAVILQGVLGGARVLLNDVAVARIHACTGPIFFCMTVAMMILTAPSALVRAAGCDHAQKLTANNRLSSGQLDGGEKLTASQATSLVKIAVVLTFVTYGQLVLGAHLRHVSPTMDPTVFRVLVFGHILTAFAVLAYGIGLWRAARRLRLVIKKWQYLVAVAVPILIAMQIGLGVGTWLVKYNWPIWLPDVALFDRFVVQEKGFVQGIVVTSHVAIGSLILASSFSIAFEEAIAFFCRTKERTVDLSNRSVYRVEATA